MPGERLYLNDSYLISFTATVTSCAKQDDGLFAITLDKTAFFPEGGGQPNDTGTIGEAHVSYVFERGGEVFHICDSDIKVGSKVSCEVDFDRRFDHMQQHTGEHILSSVLFNEFNAKKDSFHLGRDVVSVNFDRVFSAQQIDRAEELINKCISKNANISVYYPSLEEFEALKLRNIAKDIEGEIRIVDIEGIDAVTCCGTHCRSTAEVGQIKIVSFENCKGGTKIEFLCGGRAYADYSIKHKILKSLCSAFSTKPQGIEDAINNLMIENNDLKKRLHQNTVNWCRLKAEELIKIAVEVNGVKLISFTSSELTSNEAKELADALCAFNKTIALIWFANEDRLFYFFMRSNDVCFDLRQAAKAANDSCKLRGGGTSSAVQGGGGVFKGWKEAASEVLEYVNRKIIEESADKKSL